MMICSIVILMTAFPGTEEFRGIGCRFCLQGKGRGQHPRSRRERGDQEHRQQADPRFSFFFHCYLLWFYPFYYLCFRSERMINSIPAGRARAVRR